MLYNYLYHTFLIFTFTIPGTMLYNYLYHTCLILTFTIPGTMLYNYLYHTFLIFTFTIPGTMLYNYLYHTCLILTFTIPGTMLYNYLYHTCLIFTFTIPGTMLYNYLYHTFLIFTFTIPGTMLYNYLYHTFLILTFTIPGTMLYNYLYHTCLILTFTIPGTMLVPLPLLYHSNLYIYHSRYYACTITFTAPFLIPPFTVPGAPSRTLLPCWSHSALLLHKSYLFVYPQISAASQIIPFAPLPSSSLLTTFPTDWCWRSSSQSAPYTVHSLRRTHRKTLIGVSVSQVRHRQVFMSHVRHVGPSCHMSDM